MFSSKKYYLLELKKKNKKKNLYQFTTLQCISFNTPCDHIIAHIINNKYHFTSSFRFMYIYLFHSTVFLLLFICRNLCIEWYFEVNSNWGKGCSNKKVSKWNNWEEKIFIVFVFFRLIVNINLIQNEYISIQKWCWSTEIIPYNIEQIILFCFYLFTAFMHLHLNTNLMQQQTVYRIA